MMKDKEERNIKGKKEVNRLVQDFVIKKERAFTLIYECSSAIRLSLLR